MPAFHRPGSGPELGILENFVATRFEASGVLTRLKTFSIAAVTLVAISLCAISAASIRRG